METESVIQSDGLTMTEPIESSIVVDMNDVVGLMNNNVESLADQLSIKSPEDIEPEKQGQLGPNDKALKEAFEQTAIIQQNQQQIHDHKTEELESLREELDGRRHEVAEIELRTEFFGQTSDLCLNNVTEMQRQIATTDSVLRDITKATQNIPQSNKNVNECNQLLKTNWQYFNEKQEEMELDLIELEQQFQIERSTIEQQVLVDEYVARITDGKERLETETAEFDAEIEMLRIEIELKEKEYNDVDSNLATRKKKLDVLTIEKEQLEKKFLLLRDEQKTQWAQNGQLDEEMGLLEQEYKELSDENQTKKYELKSLMSEIEVDGKKRMEELKEKWKVQCEHQKEVREKNKNLLDRIRRSKQKTNVPHKAQPFSSTQVQPSVLQNATKTQPNFISNITPAPPSKPSAGIRRLLRPLQPGDEKLHPGS